MKKIPQVPIVALRMEKDDPKNTTGMQMIVWLLSNNTEVAVRLYEHDPYAKKQLWDGKRTCGQVDELVLTLLQEMKVIKNVEHWKYGTDHSNEVAKHDETDEKQYYIYFCWIVKPDLINF